LLLERSEAGCKGVLLDVLHAQRVDQGWWRRSLKANRVSAAAAARRRDAAVSSRASPSAAALPGMRRARSQAHDLGVGWPSRAWISGVRRRRPGRQSGLLITELLSLA